MTDDLSEAEHREQLIDEAIEAACDAVKGWEARDYTIAHAAAKRAFELSADEIARVRREVLEVAAKLIEDHVEIDGSKGKQLRRRQPDNIANLIYAKAIRALIDKPEGGAE